MNSVSPHSYFAYPEAFVPGAAMLVRAAFIKVWLRVSSLTLGS